MTSPVHESGRGFSDWALHFSVIIVLDCAEIGEDLIENILPNWDTTSRVKGDMFVAQECMCVRICTCFDLGPLVSLMHLDVILPSAIRLLFTG